MPNSPLQTKATLTPYPGCRRDQSLFFGNVPARDLGNPSVLKDVYRLLKKYDFLIFHGFVFWGFSAWI